MELRTYQRAHALQYQQHRARYGLPTVTAAWNCVHTSALQYQQHCARHGPVAIVLRSPAMTAYRTGPLDDGEQPPRRWGRALAAAAVLLVGTRLPMPVPGIDGNLVREFVAEAAGGARGQWTPPLLPLLGAALSTLVVVRAILALAFSESDFERRRRARRVGLAVFLVAAGAQGLALALWLEGAQVDGIRLVSEPGWSLRFALMACMTASAALTWRLATEVTRSGVAHGPLALLAAASAPSLVARWWGLGRDVAQDLIAPLAASVQALSECVPTALLAVALSRSWPTAWRRPLLRGVAPISALDLLPLPMIAGVCAARLAQELSSRSDAGPYGSVPGRLDATWVALDAHPWVAFVAGLACVLGLTRWLLALPSAPRRSAVGVAFGLPAFVLLVCTAAMLVTAGGVPRHVAAALSPFHTWTEVALRGEGAHAAEDAPRIVARLRALHHGAQALEASGDRIRLRVSPMEGTPRDVVASVLAPRRLGFYCASEDQTAVSPEGGAINGLDLRLLSTRPPRSVYSGPNIESLAPVIARSEGVSGAITRGGCEDFEGLGHRTQCYALRLDPGLTVGNADIASARVQSSPYDGRPQVELRFTPTGTSTFAALTRGCVHRVLAIVLDDRIISAPVVRQEITGGTAWITPGGAGDARHAMAEARALATGLGTGVLAQRWRLAP